MLTLVSVKISDHFDVCAYSMHGSGDNQTNVQKIKNPYSVEHCICGESYLWVRSMYKQKWPVLSAYVSIYL